MANQFSVGDIVEATAGRDESKVFIVTNVIDEEFVEIANGRGRRSESPKKKKIKHIKKIVSAHSVPRENELHTAFIKTGRLTNPAARKIISFYTEKDIEN